MTTPQQSVNVKDNNCCSLSIARVSRADHGQWMCLLNDITEFDTVSSIYLLAGIETGVKVITYDYTRSWMAEHLKHRILGVGFKWSSSNQQ